jgi:hypothetical protein
MCDLPSVDALLEEETREMDIEQHRKRVMDPEFAKTVL